MVFVAAMTLGLASAGENCETVSVNCAPGFDGGGHGGWTGIICNLHDYFTLDSYYCPEEEDEVPDYVR